MNQDQKKKVIINIVYIALLGLSLFFGLSYVLPIILPFVLGFGIAYALKPVVRKLSKITRLPEKFTSIITIVLFYGIFVSLLVWFGIEIVNTTKDLFQTLPDLYSNVLLPWLREGMDNLLRMAEQLDPLIYNSLLEYNEQLLTALGDFIRNLSMFSVTWITASANKVPTLVINILFTIISSFFFTLDYHKIVDFLLNQLKPEHKALLFNAQVFLGSTIKKYLKSYLIIMSITYVEIAIGLSILGVDKAIFIAFLIAIFDVLPVMGTGGIMIPWTIITLVEGNPRLAIGLFILYIVVTIVRNIVEPKVVGDQVGLHPIVTIFAMYLGAKLFGVGGLLGFPITLAILKGLHDSGKIVLYKTSSEAKKTSFL